MIIFRQIWDRLQQLWKRLTSKLLYKMVVIYSLLIVTPMIVIIILFYYRSTDVIEHKMKESSNQALVETADKIDGILKLFEQNMNTISISLHVGRLLRNNIDPAEYAMTTQEKQAYKEKVEQLLDREKAGNEMIDAIYLLDKDGNVIHTQQATELESVLAPSYVAHETPGRMGWAQFIDHHRLIAAMEVTDNKTDRKMGLVCIALNPEKVLDLFSTYTYGSFFIANSVNLILSAHNRSLLDTKLSFTHENKNTIINSRTSLYTGFTYYSMIPKNSLNQEINDLAYYAVAITVGAWLVALILTIVILRHITSPLIKLARLMRRAEREDFEQMTAVHTNDEIAQLCSSFNRLVREIQHLIEQVYKTELLKKETDLKALKMHLNPHFLYNTLESVSILAEEAGSREVPEMIRTLSTILRFSISRSNDFITVETELKLAESYLMLHKFRYKHRLEWRVELDQTLVAVRVPKLILQPIVENAVIHGIDQTDQPGLITIRAYEQDYDLWLEIEDNGPGFGGKMSAGGLGTGLSHVAERIQIYYGGHYGISSARTANQRTVVRVHLPIVFVNDDEGALRG